MGADDELRRAQSNRDMARNAAKRANVKRATKLKPEYHKCSECGARVRVEFKRCRRCSGINARPDDDALNRCLPGSFGSNSR